MIDYIKYWNRNGTKKNYEDMPCSTLSPFLRHLGGTGLQAVGHRIQPGPTTCFDRVLAF